MIPELSENTKPLTEYKKKMLFETFGKKNLVNDEFT